MVKYYAVKKGREAPKIYLNWNDCYKCVNGWSGAVFKSFPKLETAMDYLKIDLINADKIIYNTPKIKSKTIPKPTNNLDEINNFIQSMNLNTKSQISFLFKKMRSLDSIIVFTDGSCIGQGTCNAKAGSGICFPQFGWELSMSVPGKQTNNRGELYAVVQALKLIWCLKSFKSLIQLRNLSVEIHLDSEYVMKNVRSNNKLNLDFWKELHEILENISVIWVKELAHSGVYYNEIADKLAKKAAL